MNIFLKKEKTSGEAEINKETSRPTVDYCTTINSLLYYSSFNIDHSQEIKTKEEENQGRNHEQQGNLLAYSRLLHYNSLLHYSSFNVDHSETFMKTKRVTKNKKEAYLCANVYQ